MLLATHASILTSGRSTAPHRYRFTAPTTLPYHSIAEVRRLGGELSPGTLSAQDHWTSELLRTLSRMAASKPTSWLSW
jgi:hypothetical protein